MVMVGGGGGGGGIFWFIQYIEFPCFHLITRGRGSSFTPNVLNSLDIIKKTKDIMFDHTFSGADLARRQRGLSLGGGGVNWDWGVDFTLRKNEKEIWIPTGDLQPP